MTNIIVVHGPPGSGKSDHSRKLSQYSLDDRLIFHFSIGDHIRDIRTGNSNSAFKDCEINDPATPEYTKHQEVNGIVFEYVNECPRNSIVIVDGYPRFPEAIGFFKHSIEASNHNYLGCINLRVSQETSVVRLSTRGVRSGERIFSITSDFVENRYSEYIDHTN